MLLVPARSHVERDRRTRCRVAEQKNRELADVKARFLERQTQANNYKRRVDVIDGLRAEPDGPGQSDGHDGRDRQQHRSGVAEQDGRSGPQREPGRHGAERPTQWPT